RGPITVDACTTADRHIAIRVHVGIRDIDVGIRGQFIDLAALHRREEHEIAVRIEFQGLQGPADQRAIGGARGQHRDLYAVDELAERVEIRRFRRIVLHGIPPRQSDLCSGLPLRSVPAISSSSFSVIDSYIDFDAPLSSPTLVSPRFADSAAPAAFCWDFDFAGMVAPPNVASARIPDASRSHKPPDWWHYATPHRAGKMNAFLPGCLQ